jgi:hypothetical protein
MKQLTTHQSKIFTLLSISPILRPERRNGVSTNLVGIALAAVVASTAFVGVAHAQSGHFVGTPTCRDIGTQVQCTGKVAGLGGTTFMITVTAPGTGSIECTNPAGNVAPGQSFDTTVGGSIGPIPTPRNGQFTFRLTTADPSAPAGSCPNRKWTADVVDVEFTGDAIITLQEGNSTSDTVTVPVE